MIRINVLGVFCAAFMLISSAVEGATDVNLAFDGVTDSGWSLLNLNTGFDPAEELLAFSDHNGSGLNGIGIRDLTPGVSFYAAPIEITSMNLNDVRLNFSYEIQSARGELNTQSVAEVYLNQTPVAIDIFDETTVDTLLTGSIDFNDPAFSSFDLSSVSSLYIKAEFYSGESTPESYLLAAVQVPEPGAMYLLLPSALGVLGFVRRRIIA